MMSSSICRMYFAVWLYVDKGDCPQDEPSIIHLIMAKEISSNITAKPPKAVLLTWFISFEPT